MTRACRRWTLAPLLLLLTLLASCGSGGSGGAAGSGPAGEPVLFVVSAPLSTSRWIGEFVQRGAQLAADELNADGGIAGRPVRVEVLDHAGSPQQAVANARTAVARDAAALITDGVGAVAVAGVTDPAQLPVFVTFEGGESIIDPQARPTLFRLAPANAPMSRRLADYVSEKVAKVALLGDSSSYGREGVAATAQGLAVNKVEVVASATLPDGGGDVAAQVLAARQAGAQALIVWADAGGVVAVVRAARGAGWEVPIYTGPTGEDPLVRQRLADHPEWLDGLTFVSFRITSEAGPEPFQTYRTAYERKFGADGIGVQAGGREVVQPPDWSTYSYDAVKLSAAALATGQPLLAALDSTVITGANGDERGFGPTDREGVSPDDMYFGRFTDLRFAPVTDDLLSVDLPPVAQ